MTLEEIKQEAIRNLIETLDNEEGIVLRDDNDDILPYINKAFDSLIAKAYEAGYEAGKQERMDMASPMYLSNQKRT